MRIRSFLVSVILTSVAAFTPTMAGEVFISTPGFHGMRYSVPIISLKEGRFKTILAQQYDFSCGSAALASLLTYHYKQEITEAELFEAMYIVGDKESIHRYGFSLLDMKRFLESVGWTGDGFKISLDQLAEVGVPAITLIDTNGYKHFVVVKGIRGDEVVLGDPARGVMVVRRDEFEQIWNGIVFVIRDNVEVANATFNQDDDWNVRVRAPVQTAMVRQGLASFTMNLPGLAEF